MKTRQEFEARLLKREANADGASIEALAGELYAEERAKAAAHIADLKIAYDLAAKRADDVERCLRLIRAVATCDDDDVGIQLDKIVDIAARALGGGT